MKKANLLSKADMKKIAGGGLPPGDPGNPPCLDAFVVCGVEDGGMELINFTTVCCETLADAEAFCRGQHYTGTYQCLSLSVS